MDRVLTHSRLPNQPNHDEGEPLWKDSTSASTDQLRRLREAQKTNTQVSGAWRVDSALGSLEARTGKSSIPLDIDPDDVPF